MKTIIAKKFALWARYCADMLNRKTQKLSPLKMKIYLLLFCLTFSAASTYFILQAFVSKNMVSNAAFVNLIPIPAHIGKTGDKQVIFFVTPAEYERVEKLKTFLDSIARADKKKFNQILQLRPHLADSILMFEKLYLLQSKR